MDKTQSRETAGKILEAIDGVAPEGSRAVSVDLGRYFIAPWTDEGMSMLAMWCETCPATVHEGRRLPGYGVMATPLANATLDTFMQAAAMHEETARRVHDKLEAEVEQKNAEHGHLG